MYSATVSGHKLILSGWNLKTNATTHRFISSKLDAVLESAWPRGVVLGVSRRLSI
jgi:hypothetical protein